MNEHTIDDLVRLHKAGEGRIEYFVTITDEMLETYAKMFEKISPIHTDDAYAREQGFKARIVPQLMVVSQLLPMAEEHLPGKYGLGLGATDLVFKNAVYVGDRLCFKGEIAKISRAAKLIVLAIQISNQDDVPVVECTWKIKVLK